MAEHNDALQTGLISKDLQVSQSARSRKLRFDNEKTANKQEFAKAYSRELRKQVQAVENKATDKQAKRSATKSHRELTANQHSMEGKRFKQTQQSPQTTSAENGSNLPQIPHDGSSRQENTVTQENDVAVSQETISPGVAERVVVESRYHGINRQGYDAVSDASSAFSIGNHAGDPQIVSEKSAATHIGVSSNAELASGFNNASRGTNAFSMLQPQQLSSENIPASTFGVGALSGSSIGQAAQPQSLPNGLPVLASSQAEQSSVTIIAAGDKFLSLGGTTETLDPELGEKAAKSTGDTLLRSIELNLAKAPIQINDLDKNILSTAKLFATLHSGRSGQESDGSTQPGAWQESALFKDRLLALTQQNIGQSSNASVNDLNKLLAQQTSQLDPLIDETSNDVNVNTVKESGVSIRPSGGTLNMLTPMLQMSTSLDHKGWSNEVGQRVMWMVNSDLQQAQLQLNPKHLGPIEIKITLTADQQVNVNFLTHSNTVKEALDQALPRLREVFDQSGLNLNDVNVQQESHKQHRDHRHTAGNGSADESHLAENMHEEVSVARIFQNQTLSSNIVDFYA